MNLVAFAVIAVVLYLLTSAALTVRLAGPASGLRMSRGTVLMLGLGAVTLHGWVLYPDLVTGQGLNLGFRDVAALSETIVDAHRLGLDIGALNILQRYERWRRFDTWQMGVTTDLMNRLFSNDIAPVRSIRDIGLGIVERMPGLKKMFIGEAAGFGSETPKLLEGEGL